MTLKLAMSVLLTWMLAMANGSANETLIEEPPMEAVTKYVNGVPIYNYQFFSKHAKKSSVNEKEATPFTTWIVKAHDEYDQKMRNFCIFSGMGKRHCTRVTESFSSLHFNGTQDELALFLNAHHTMVEFVEPDSEVNIAQEVPTPELPGVLQSDPDWGLDRIDSRKCRSGGYFPGIDGGHGKGINVYVVDTGIRITHEDFEGRAAAAFDVFRSSQLRLATCSPTDTTCAADGHSHGTHCAGTVGGKKYGVAKDVKLHAVKVLSDEGPGSTAGILRGIDWVVAHGEKPAIISMSIQGKGRTAAYATAIDAAFNKGVTVVVAAGNKNVDACTYSPAYVPSAITVGSTINPVGNDCQDRISYFSNFGSCLDIWAPGSSIKSTGNRCDTCWSVKSGTSMACPAVAGAVALVYAAYPGVKPSQVPGMLKEHATEIPIIGEREYPKPNSPSDFLYIGLEWQVPGVILTTTLAAYNRMPKACVAGHNIAWYHAQTVEQCQKICDATPSCVGFEYGVDYGGGGRYKAGDCIPNDSADSSNCDGASHNLDFYVSFAVYKQMPKACVSGHNIAVYKGKTRAECGEICGTTPSCVGFEYGVAYGGGGRYKAGDCIPNDSDDSSGCDGAYFNLDFYIKDSKQSVLEEHQTEEQAVTEIAADGKLFQVSIGVSAVVGIIMSVKWHKGAARKVQVKPLLG